MKKKLEVYTEAPVRVKSVTILTGATLGVSVFLGLLFSWLIYR